MPLRAERPLTALSETSVDQEELLHIIDHELQDLPTLPSVVLKVMDTVNRPTTSASDIKKIISSDPALTAKILRLGNSAFYGFPGKIATLNHAIVILGFSTVRNLAISLGASNILVASKAQSSLDRHAFWAHSLATAYASSELARRMKEPARIVEEVFIGGLLHDIGKLFLDRYFPEEYAVAIASAQVHMTSILDAERTVLGVTHECIGRRVAEKWNLPQSMIAMVGRHHNSAEEQDYPSHVKIVHAADYVARKLNLASIDEAIDPALTDDVRQWFNFSEEQWETIESQTLKNFAGASDFVLAMLGK